MPKPLIEDVPVRKGEGILLDEAEVLFEEEGLKALRLEESKFVPVDELLVLVLELEVVSMG